MTDADSPTASDGKDPSATAGNANYRPVAACHALAKQTFVAFA
jgi:hypothetical protein